MFRSKRRNNNDDDNNDDDGKGKGKVKVKLRYCRSKTEVLQKRNGMKWKEGRKC